MRRWVADLLIVLAIGFCWLFVFVFILPIGEEVIDLTDYQCPHNLREIAQLATLYWMTSGESHFSHSPEGSLASLERLGRTEWFDTPKVFVCPAGEERAPQIEDGELTLTDETCSYEMVSWRIPPRAADAILAYDKLPRHDRGRYVVFTDASVRLLEEDEFQRLYAEQRARYGSDRRQ